MHLHHHEDVLEVRADVLGTEGLGPGLLEHDGDDVVPDVALSEQLWGRQTKHRRELWHAGDRGARAEHRAVDLPAACCWGCRAAWWTRGT